MEESDTWKEITEKMGLWVLNGSYLTKTSRETIVHRACTLLDPPF